MSCANVLRREEVHVWRIEMAEPRITLQESRRLLSADELKRSERFHFQRDRDHFVVVHGALRCILSSYLRVAPDRLDFRYSVYGKPDLAPEVNPIGLKFNLSHSGRLALIAVTASAEIGIDIELICGSFGSVTIAKRFFSSREVEVLCSLPASEQVDAFFNCWTRKEAYIKARGEGLGIPLDSFDVAFAPGENPALLSVKFDPREISRWSIYDLQVDENYKAALAVEGKPDRTLYCEWKGSVVL